MARTLRIDAYVDLICPWCLIGKAQLRQALARLGETAPEVAVDLQWHSVQLIPDAPEDGWPFEAFYLRRLGSPQAVQVRRAQVLAAAAQAGVRIAYGRIARFPNTARAHRLLALGRQQLDAAGLDALLDRLYAAYFSQGEDLGDPATLVAIGAAHGLDADRLRTALAEMGPPVPSPGVSGVPFFVFDQQLALSGAQPPQALFAAMRQALSSPQAPQAGG